MANSVFVHEDRINLVRLLTEDDPKSVQTEKGTGRVAFGSLIQPHTQMRINLEVVTAKMIGIGFKFISEVATGYGSTGQSILEAAVAFEYDGAIVCCKHSNFHVHNIFLDEFRIRDLHQVHHVLVEALLYFGTAHNLFLNDFEIFQRIDLKSKNNIVAYMTET